MKLPRMLSFGVLAGLVLGLGTFLEARAQAGMPAEKDKPNSRRIWTNDDLVYLRHPWDVYMDQKAAAEEAARTAARASQETKGDAEGAGGGTSSNSPNTAVLGASVPKTVEEAESCIQQKQEEIGYQQELIDRTERQYRLSNEYRERETLKKDLDLLNTDLEAAKTELKALQDKLKELKGKVSTQPAQPAAVSTRL